MKIIATRIPTPLDENALKLYEEEFSKKENGFVLFPEGSIEENKIVNIYELSNYYKIGIIGTVKEGNSQRSIVFSNGPFITGPKSYSGEFIPPIISNSSIENMTANRALLEFYKNDSLLRFNTGRDELNALVRICSDIGLPYLGKDISDILLVPSAIEHPAHWFNKNIGILRKNLSKDAKIVYSPLPSQVNLTEKYKSPSNNTQMGIYNIHLKQIGKIKGDYSVLEVKD